MKKKQRTVFYDYPLNTEVPVIECGPFAIHRPLDSDLVPWVNEWAVTHVGTGYGLASPITAAQARHLVRDLARLPIDWEGINHANYQETWTTVEKRLAHSVMIKLGIMRGVAE